MKIRNFVLLVVVIFVVVGYNNLNLLFPMKHYDTVSKYATEQQLDPLLVMSIIKTESGFKDDAVSKKSAKGLMQITGDTAKWCAEKIGISEFDTDMLFDTDTNIKIGTFYLGYLLKRYDNELSCAVAAYNAGMGNVDKWLKDETYSKDGKTIDTTPFGETTAYINKIKFNYKMYNLIYGGNTN